ncbi:hypothetical protein QUF75_02295 [Desulfococcaceae bacterium HSG7]|nr:hypothetical protein [Desulfococcaceae bacterium HSG7]
MLNIRRCFGAVLLLFLVGCAIPTKNEFTTFAQTGSSYAVAVDKLLVAASAAQVDSTSWTLVQERNTTGMDDDTYFKKNKEDIDRLAVIVRLRRHAQFLGQYFVLLETLATSDTPDRTKTAIDGVVSELNKIKAELSPVVAALPAIGKVAIDLKIRAALREELNFNKKTIRAHLVVQEQLLKELANQIKHALKLNKSVRERTLVVDKIVAKKKLKNPEKWVSARRKVFFTSLTIDDLGVASLTATKLREAFESLISGEMTIGRINALITDVEGLLSIAETINS